LISANMVTVVRLLPMPLLSWWVYRGLLKQDEGALWLALIVGTLIGCTDFVDGYLARKHGPTVFGGLLDPLADKVFVAFVYLPFADLGQVPAWAVALMFVRELLVTALRSAYEQRGLTLKTSYLAKAKTWTQMQGIGMLVLFPLLDSRHAISIMLGIGIALPLVGGAVLYAIRKKVWPGAFWMSGAFVGIMLVHLNYADTVTLKVMMGLIVAITWLSGVDYVLVGFKQLRGRGDFGRADLVRLLAAVVLPVAIYAALIESPAPAWPIIAVLALELAVGGLDNLLSHHRRAAKALLWGARTLGAAGLLGLTVVLKDQAQALAIAAFAISLLGVGYEFWRGKDYYLDKRIRELALKNAAASGS
jgi:CDP-diacylglycerol--glycerol-3-phosphate 3-phosphatidyltransferase